MSKTIHEKPYVSVPLTESSKIRTGTHRTYIVKKRLRDEDGNLWGIIAESNGIKYRIDISMLLGMLTVEKIPFVVDWTGNDRPATLTVAHKRTPNGMTYFFKTIGDKYMKNNFNNVPELKAQSSSLRSIKRLK